MCRNSHLAAPLLDANFILQARRLLPLALEKTRATEEFLSRWFSQVPLTRRRGPRSSTSSPSECSTVMLSARRWKLPSGTQPRLAVIS